ESALTLARRRTSDPSHIYTYVNALAFAARVHLLLQNATAVNQFSRELVDISRRNQYAYFEAIGTIQQGWALARTGELHRGAQQMVDGLKVLEATGTGLGVRGFYVQLAELYVLLENKREALSNLELAMGPPGWGTRAWDAEIQRVQGTALMIGPDANPDAALSCCRTAVDIARKQGARPLKGRAGASVARILMKLGRRPEACNLLSPYLPPHRDTADGEIEMLLGELTPEGDRA